MRKLLFCSGIFLCFSGSALAQQASGGAPGEWSLHAAFGAVVVGLIVANAYVVSLFHAKPPGESSGVLARLAEKWEFSPQGLGGFSWRQLALWSLLALFFELLMIRWISSEIRVFAYFKNFVLIACFLGFGLGCYLCRRRVRAMAWFVPLLVIAVVVSLPWPGLRELVRSMPTLIGALSEVDVWGVPSLPNQGNELLALAKSMIIVVPLFGLVAFIFVPLGQLVGWYLEKAPRGIKGYTLNIVGSLARIRCQTSRPVPRCTCKMESL